LSTTSDATEGEHLGHGLLQVALEEILRDSHRYAPGLGQHTPTKVDLPISKAHRRVLSGRDHLRNTVERVASRAGFTRRHFDPSASATKLLRVTELAAGLEDTYARFGDEESRRALVDVIKLRVLGPYHAPLSLTPEAYKAKQTYADERFLEEKGTFEVSDPYFSPLSRYTVPVPGGAPVSLHSHSVDIVSVYMVEQYAYRGSGGAVTVEPGDIVCDIGGCWGDTALLFANMVGPEGKVYTFEFDPENLEIMRTNLALNPELASRIEIVERALWDRSNQSLPFVQGGRMTHLGDGGDAEDHQATLTITLDDFVAEAGLDRIDFVKMDVEGAEMKVLAGAGDALRRFAPKLALAAYHKDDDLVQIPGALNALDVPYRYYLKTASPLEDETVLFAARNSST
jgi:FkbM family methyltransferase